MTTPAYRSSREEWKLDTLQKCHDVLFARKLVRKRTYGIVDAINFLYETYPEFKAMNCTKQYIAEEILGVTREAFRQAMRRNNKNGKNME